MQTKKVAELETNDIIGQLYDTMIGNNTFSGYVHELLTEALKIYFKVNGATDLRNLWCEHCSEKFFETHPMVSLALHVEYGEPTVKHFLADADFNVTEIK